MQRKGKIGEQKLKTSSRRSDGRSAGSGRAKIHDILPPEKLRRISRHLIGLRDYPSRGKKIFASVWRLSIAVFFIFSLAFGFNPLIAFKKTILALGGAQGKVELFAGACESDYPGIEKNAGWWYGRRAAGAPSVARTAQPGDFSDGNSAAYYGGRFALTCLDFDQANGGLGQPETAAPEILSEPADGEPENATSTTGGLADVLSEPAPQEETASTSEPQIMVENEAGLSQVEIFDTSLDVQAQVIPGTPEAVEPILDGQILETAPEIADQKPAATEPGVEVIELPAEASEADVIDEPSAISRFFAPARKAAAGLFASVRAWALGSDQLEDLGIFSNARVKLSYAVIRRAPIEAESVQPALRIWYSTDDAGASPSEVLWQEAAVIDDGEASNFSNGGYASFDLPGVADWSGLSKIRLKLEGQAQEPDYSLSVDSIWLEAVYDRQEIKREVTDKDRARWAEMMELVSEKNDFLMDEGFSFRFRYDKNFSSLGTIFGFSSFWSDVNLSASLADSSGSLLPLPLSIVFEEGGFFQVEALEAPREFRPGKYKIRFEIEDSSGAEAEIIELAHDFSWGVLALNTDKSIYLPGNSAYLQMAVLDDLGHTICDADLSLAITAPDGGVALLSTANGLIIRNPECGPDNVILSPDYSGYYSVGVPGTYRLSLEAATRNGVKTVTDEFEVRESVPFDIERSGPTRIFPKADYGMKIRIRANEDYQGEITEIVPRGFKISNVKNQISNQIRMPENPDFGVWTLDPADGEQRIVWKNIELAKDEELELTYTFDAPDISPEFYLLGPVRIGAFAEIRKWQIASDAVQYRAKTVQFLGGAYSANGTTGQNSNTNQTFPQFNFRLMENSVTIKSAYVILEAQFESYNNNNNAYTGSNVVFDACSGSSCGANAWTGTSSAATNDATVIANDETESNQARILLDVTGEAEMAAYAGGGAPMQAQIGYRFNRAAAVNSISYAKAILVVTYTYDKNSSDNLTNTVIYPLESRDSKSGTKATSTAANCVFSSTCPGFDYNMDIPEFDSANGSVRLSQWFQMEEQNDLNLANDVTVNLKIGSNATSSDFVHEAALSDQANIPTMFFPNVAGYAEKTAQTIEYRAAGTAGTHYLIGGEIVETYSASSSAAVKTRTVSFPIGVITNGNSTASSSASVDIYFPENGQATGTVEIKKAWLRVSGSNYLSGAASLAVQAKAGDNASSSIAVYNHDPAGTNANTGFTVYHVLPSADYAELQNANASVPKTLAVNTRNSAVSMGGVTAELMITYAYADDAKGYLSSLDIFGGQMLSAPALSATATAANLVFPEIAGKTMLAAGLRAAYLESTAAGGGMPGANINNYFDVNIGASEPSCSASAYRIGIGAQNLFAELHKAVPVSSLGTTDNQPLTTCFASAETAGATVYSKMNSTVNYVYAWVDSPPTGTIDSIINRKDGTGLVELEITVDDADKDDLAAKIEYEAGTSCTFASAAKLTLDESSASSTYGTVGIDNLSGYQIGTGTGMIITSSGANTVSFDWPTKNDLPNADDTYCVRLIANDGAEDQAISATATIAIDNIAPTAPGQLLATGTKATSTLLAFTATTTENNFSEYKIFYKVYDGNPVTEADTLIGSSSDPNLGVIDFNGATSTEVALSAGNDYSFNIWAYDTFGNKASSTQINLSTNSLPTSTIISAVERTDGSGRVDISFLVDDDDNDDTLRAKIDYEAGSSCAFSAADQASLDDNPANISASFGVPVVDNASSYQVGSSSGWIITSPGQNTIGVDWLSQADVPAADGTYCLRLIVNDGQDDQPYWATTTLTLDNAAPTAPGNLTLNSVTTNSITLNFGATTTETNFQHYKIFYKTGTAGVTESDTEHADANLSDIDYNGAFTATIPSLLSKVNYVFNIWAYDSYGNKSNATEITAMTDGTITNDSLSFINPQAGNIAIGNGVSEYIFRAVVSELNGWNSLASTTLRLADSVSSSSPYSDLAYAWDASTGGFTDVGGNLLNSASLSPNSTSTCAGNSCTLDFVVIFNHRFATSSQNYDAELVSGNDSAEIDDDNYNDLYQVKTVKISQKHYRWRNDNGGN